MSKDKSLEHLTEWQSLARDFRESELRGDKSKQDRLIRHAYNLFLSQMSIVPRHLNPSVFQRPFILQRTSPEKSRVATSTNGAWLDEMAKWSRTVEVES